jgi:transposase
LIPIIESSNELAFQHDNDPKHRENITKQFLENKDIVVLEWPYYSPDLNPIENFWKILKERVYKHKSKNSKEFTKNIIQEGKKIDTNILQSLINSMSSRIQEVINNGGDITMY